MWLCNIKEWTGVKTVEEIFKLAKNTERCKELTSNGGDALQKEDLFSTLF